MRKKIVSLAVAGALGGVGLTVGTFLSSGPAALACTDNHSNPAGRLPGGLVYESGSTSGLPTLDPGNLSGYIGVQPTSSTYVEAGGTVTSGGAPSVPPGGYVTVSAAGNVQCVPVP